MEEVCLQFELDYAHDGLGSFGSYRGTKLLVKKISEEKILATHSMCFKIC